MPTHHAGTREETRALDAYITLMRAAGSVTARQSPILTELDLTTSQFGVLEAILHRGPLRPNELATKILKTTGNLTLVVDNLEKRDLIIRRRDPDDRRCVKIDLSTRGRALVKKAFPRVLAAIVASMRALSPTEQEDLHRLCRKLGLGQGSASSARVREFFQH